MFSYFLTSHQSSEGIDASFKKNRINHEQSKTIIAYSKAIFFKNLKPYEDKTPSLGVSALPLAMGWRSNPFAKFIIQCFSDNHLLTIKKLFAMIYRLILALVVVVSFFSCGEDGFPLIGNTTIPGDDPALSGSGNVEGNWVVRQFVDEGEDETASFSGIVLAFEPDGVFKMRRNSNLAATGNWNLENNGRELNIVVPVFENQNESLGEDLYEIHDSWQLSDISDDEIHLVEEDEFFVLVRQ